MNVLRITYVFAGDDAELIYCTWFCACNFATFISCSHSKGEVAFEEENSSEPMETTFTFDQTAGGKFLSLDDLGNLLLHLASQGYYHIFFTTRFFSPLEFSKTERNFTSMFLLPVTGHLGTFIIIIIIIL